MPDITRIAPSPTGKMHIGTARTAYFCYLAAKATGGKFILRIDDTDDNRNSEENVKVIYDTLEWLGLDWDECYRQSQRSALYKEFATTLSRGKLTQELDNGAIALKWHDRYGDRWTDSIAGEVPITTTNKEQIDGRLILLRGKPKEQGLPDNSGKVTYQFASIVDDWDLGVNHIIRGTDHISNTCKQVAIWHAINEVYGRIAKFCDISIGASNLPKFSHVGLIFKDKKKMSKRAGDPSCFISYFKDGGYSPDAVLNFLLRLGWGGKEIPDKPITREQAINLFTKGQMKNVNVGYDQAKLDFFNRFYQKRKVA